MLGPEDLSFNDMARITSEVLERPIRYQQVPLDADEARLIGLGMPEAMAQRMTAAKNEGLDNRELRTPENTHRPAFGRGVKTS